MDDLASPEFPEKLEIDDTEENVRSGEGHDEIAGVGDIDGEGEESRTGYVDCNPSSAISGAEKFGRVLCDIGEDHDGSRGGSQS